jgi:hypothetical protein
MAQQCKGKGFVSFHGNNGYANAALISHIRGAKFFQKSGRRQVGDKEHISLWGHTNFTRHCTKFSHLGDQAARSFNTLRLPLADVQNIIIIIT